MWSTKSKKPVSRRRAWAMDMADKAMIASVTAEIAEAFGGLDIIVNNAGFAMGANIDDAAYPVSWEKSLAVMLEGPQVLIREALAHLRASDAARIINIASTEGLGGSAGNSPYTAAKHGIIGLTKGLAVELGKQGITVNAVCPGPIHAGITEAIPDEHKQTFARRRTALRRYGMPKKWRISPCRWRYRRPAILPERQYRWMAACGARNN